MTRAPVASRLLIAPSNYTPVVSNTRLVGLRASSPYVEIWDGNNQETMKGAPDTAFAMQSVYRPALSKNGRYLATRTASATSPLTRLYDLSSGSPVTAQSIGGFGGPAYGSAFSPDGKWLAVTCNASPFLYIVNLTNFSIVNVPAPSRPTSFCEMCEFNAQGTRLIVANTGNSTLKIYSFNTGTGVATLLTDLATTNFSVATSMKFSKSGRIFAAVSTDAPGARVWSVNSDGTVFTPATVLPGNTSAPRQVDISPDDAWIAVAYGVAPYLKVFSYPSMALQTIASPPIAPTYGVAFDVDSNSLLVSGDYAMLLKYDAATWTKSIGVSRSSSDGRQLTLTNFGG